MANTINHVDKNGTCTNVFGSEKRNVTKRAQKIT